MTQTKAARNSCNCSTPKASTTRDVQIITEYELTTLIAGVIIAVSFGLMFVWGAWAGW